jgi:mono/diheme cytochrome c family protein
MVSFRTLGHAVRYVKQWESEEMHRLMVGVLLALPLLARPASAQQAPDGQKVFSQTCVACHQSTGLGVPGAFPPLAGSEWVNGDKAQLVRIVLHGLTGDLQVKGEDYEGMMPPWGQTLGNPEIAAVLTYIRSSWGNKGDAVTAAEVASIRDATGGRSGPWTAKELVAATVKEK